MDPQHARQRGFLAGVIAGVPTAAAGFVVGSLMGQPTPAELFADPILDLLPGPVFGALIDALQYTAKALLLAGLLLGQLVVGGWVGRVWAGQGADVKAAFVVVGTFFALFELAVLPLLGWGLAPHLLGFGLVHLVYGVSLVAAHRWLRDRPPAPGRRRALAAFGAAGLAVVGGGTLWQAAAGGSMAAGATFGGPTGDLPDEVTPLDRFYTVSKNLADPRVDGSTWQLRIDGQVERPITLTYEALGALPSQEQHFTLACISNPVGGYLIGNGHWRGVALRDLLGAAGLKPGVRKVVFHAADGYADSILLAKALEPRTLVAYQLNGAPLDHRHGAPARLLIPGIYGMKNVKWVTRIELLDRDFRGYWQEKGWSDAAVIHTLSRIDTPASGRTVGRPVRLGGIAHAGDRGIRRVEVSADGGRSWLEASLRPPLAPDSWTIWTLEWTPPAPGSYQLRVRATDVLDRVQLAERVDSFPDGARGLHSATIRVT